MTLRHAYAARWMSLRVRVVVAVLLAALVAPPVAQAQGGPGFRVEIEGPAIATADAERPYARFYLRVTNEGPSLDYFTIPRTDIRWSSGQTALGFPSPEFGLPLAAGEAGRMFVHVEASPPAAGANIVTIPVRSERTGATVSVQATLQTGPAPPANARLVAEVVDERGAPVEGSFVEVTRLRVLSPFATVPRDPTGRHAASFPPGDALLHAGAPGHGGASARVALPAGEETRVRLVLPVATHIASLASMRNGSVDDSAWLMAASRDLGLLVTSPMTHSERTPGAFVAVDEDGERWRAPFDALRAPHDRATQFQASDAAVAVSPDGARVAGVDWNGRLHVLDGRTGQTAWATDGPSDPHPLYPPESVYRTGFFAVGAVAFSPDGERLAAGGGNGRVALYDADGGAPLWSRAFGGEVRALRFTPDGEALAVGAGDWRFRLLDAATGETRWEAENEFWPFFFVGMDANASRLATGGKDSVLRVLDGVTGDEIYRFDAFPAFITGGDLLEDGGVVVPTWGPGVSRLDAEGDLVWHRALPTAVAAATPDGGFTLVGWQDPGRARGLVLLDATGATLWASAPALMETHCTSTVSPFPAPQPKTVLLHRVDASTLRAAASCIGGGVFQMTFHVEARAAAPPPASSTPPTADGTTPPSPGAVAPPPVGSTDRPTSTGADAPFPALLLVAALGVGAALRRRR